MAEAFATTQRLRFCDTDQVGHVNNGTYAVMYEAGRTELLHAHDLFDARFSVVIARLEIDFLREMNWPGEVRIETEVARFGTKSLHLRQRLLLAGEIVSRAMSVLAAIDTQTRRSLPLPEPWRAALARYHVPEAPAA